MLTLISYNDAKNAYLKFVIVKTVPPQNTQSPGLGMCLKMYLGKKFN